MKNINSNREFNNKGYVVKNLQNPGLLSLAQNSIIRSKHDQIKKNFNFIRTSIRLQNKLYKKNLHFKIIKNEKEFFKKIFKIKNLSELMITSFFHLRAVKKNSNKKKSNFLGFHRETFYSDFDYTQHQVNVSVPILNYSKKIV